MNDLTQVLAAIEQGDARASEELLPLVYHELRRMAAHKMASEPAGHTLQPIALVHEAWLQLVDSRNQSWQNRAHFFGAAAGAMRRSYSACTPGLTNILNAFRIISGGTLASSRKAPTCLSEPMIAG